MEQGNHMRILITNDDGLHAEGLHALRRELSQVAQVTVIAPDRPRSACAHSITLHKPLRVEQVRLDEGEFAYICTGTPSDCVVLGVEAVLGQQPDVVVSGINLGPNLGDDVTYSGTVAAAMEGTIMGIKSFSISVTDCETTDFTAAAKFARRLAVAMRSLKIPTNTLLNVNVPNLPEARIKGYAFTRQGHHRYLGAIEERHDPRGGTYYWRGGEVPDDPEPEGTDVTAIASGRISVTPLVLDLTHHAFLSELQKMHLGPEQV